jgi:hypothetical protein
MGFNLAFKGLIAQHVSSDTPLIIRSLKTVKPEAAITVFDLLMMSGVSLETCSAIKNIGIINSTTRPHHVAYFYKICRVCHPFELKTP